MDYCLYREHGEVLAVVDAIHRVGETCVFIII